MKTSTAVLMLGIILFLMGGYVGISVAQGGSLDNTPLRDPTPAISCK